MKLLISTVCLAGALAFGQATAPIAPPQVGFIQDGAHSLRQVLGLAGNFVVGDSLGEGVVSSAFSGSFGMVKTDASILVLDRDGQLLSNMDADSGPALFAFSSEGNPVYVYLPQTATLLRWISDHLEPMPFSADQIGGVVLAIAATDPGSFSVVAKRDDGAWLIDLSTSSQSLIAAVDGPVLLRADGSLLYATADGFVLRQAEGTEAKLGGAGVRPSAFEQMGRDWVHVTEENSGRHFAIRLSRGQEQVYLLPETQTAEGQPEDQQ